MKIRLFIKPDCLRHYHIESGAHRRRIESWRMETAADAVTVAKAFHSGKLKSTSAASIISYLRLAKSAMRVG